VLDAAGDDDVLEAGRDLPGGEVDRLLAGAAHPVELDPRRAVAALVGGPRTGVRRYLFAPPRDEGRDASDVRPLVALRRHAAVHHVVHDGRVEAVAFLEGPERGRREVLGVRVPERPVALPERRPYRVHDDWLVHR
jgi:hypothetical protein